MNKTLLVVLGLTLAAVFVGVTLYHHQHQDHHPLGASEEIPTAVYDLWTHWKNQNQKKYGDEDNSRLQIFYSNYKTVMTHQSNPSRTYEMGFTKFMDLTKEEFKMKYLSSYVPEQPAFVRILPTEGVPASVDWRTKGAVTPIKDQGQCGSCWAFSTTGALEGRCFLDGFGLHAFSEQQLVDCSGSFGNQGCNGGLMNNAWEYLEKNCLCYEGEYPYKAVDGTCKSKKGENKISTYTAVAEGNVNQLQAGAAQQPVSVAVDASNWQFYSSGVFSDCSTSLDHGVLLVGYNSDAWIVKNSWGASWGENGFIRLKRGNTCGIANAASYPDKCLKC
jgi:C1A family cysteine protease